MFGCNDNPSARQLESAWRKLLGQHQITASDSANCINNDVKFLNVLNVSSRNQKASIKVLNTFASSASQHDNNNSFCESHDNDLGMEDHDIYTLTTDDSFSNNIADHICCYMASVLEKNIIEGRWYAPLRCENCLCVFSEDVHVDDEFVKMKMKTSKLRAPAQSTVLICKATEIAMEKFKFESGQLNAMKNDIISNLCLSELFPLSDFDVHDKPEHKMHLINLIIEMYVKKKHDYISRCNTLAEHNVFLRNKFRKILHFLGQ